MEQHLTLGKKERESIFELFTTHKQLKFSEIEKELSLRSNHLTYHLDHMIKHGILLKEGDSYKLTQEAEKMIPHFAHITQKERGPLSIITAAVMNNNKVCLLKRNKRPYKGLWSLIGGKIISDESISDAALREVHEESGISATFNKIESMLHERVQEDGKTKHAFVIFFCSLHTTEEKLRHTEEGELQWFDVNNLPENMIPSDKHMVEELIEKPFCCTHVVVEEKNGEMLSMELDHE